MGAPGSIHQDLGVPLLQENRQRVRDELGRRRRGERRVRLAAERLEKGLGRTMDASEGLQNEGY